MWDGAGDPLTPWAPGCLPAWAQMPLSFCALPLGAVPAPKARVLVPPLSPEGSPRWTAGSSRPLCVVAGIAHCPRDRDVILLSNWRAGSTRSPTPV